MPRARASVTVLCLTALSLVGARGPEDSGTQPADPPRRPPVSAAEIDDTLRLEGTEIAARERATRMTVAVHVNGAGPYRFVVDSGADTSVVGAEIAALLDLPKGESALLHGMTESRSVATAEVESLRIGPANIEHLELPVLHERHIGGDGMIGLDALVSHRLVMDFDKKIITIDDGREPIRWYDNVIVVTGRRYRGQLILTEVRADKVRVDAVIDTGSEITIGNLALRDQLFRNGMVRSARAVIRGVTGAEIAVDMATVPLIRIGGITLENVNVAFADVPPFAAFGLQEKPSLMLGTDLMSSFRRISLDFNDRKVRFQLRRCARSAVRLSTFTMISRVSANSKLICQD